MHRRSFLKRATALINAVVGLVLAIPALRYLFDPLWRRRKVAGFARIALLSAVPKGRPIRVVVYADRYDAYTHYPPGPVGSVWLIREAGAATGAAGLSNARSTSEGTDQPPKIRCLQTICPHLGCAVDYVKDRDLFSCPCHGSSFDAAGKRISGPAPRDMDELECRITAPDKAGRRWIEVRYEEFRAGVTGELRIADRGFKTTVRGNRHSTINNASNRLA